MTDARQVQLLHDVPVSVTKFAHAMANALSQGMTMRAMRRTFIPRSKGSHVCSPDLGGAWAMLYITFPVRDRSSLYERLHREWNTPAQ